jgi:hypothetical protein
MVSFAVHLDIISLIMIDKKEESLDMLKETIANTNHIALAIIEEMTFFSHRHQANIGSHWRRAHPVTAIHITFCWASINVYPPFWVQQ